MADLSDQELLEALGVEAEPEKKAVHSPREERIIDGFEDIQRFVEQHGRVPAQGEDRDIFERLYAVRLDRVRELEECRALLEPRDHQGVLAISHTASREVPDEIDDDELLAQLGIDEAGDGITELRHVRTSAEKRAAEKVARRERCADFEKFKPLFQNVQRELSSGARESRPFELKAEIRPESFFIVGGQKAYVAEMGEIFTTDQGRSDARLRVIFDNGTESNMLMRSLQRALNGDEAGRRITDSSAVPLFGDAVSEGDETSGTIYVLRSKSDHPVVAANRDVMHKIGVTNLSVKQRIAGARLQPTFLMADVEVVATYELFNINRNKLEKLLHRVFDPARLDIEIKDRFGNPSVPREWFLVPLDAVNEAVERLKDGSLTKFVYNPKLAALKPRKAADGG